MSTATIIILAKLGIKYPITNEERCTELLKYSTFATRSDELLNITCKLQSICSQYNFHETHIPCLPNKQNKDEKKMIKYIVFPPYLHFVLSEMINQYTTP